MALETELAQQEVLVVPTSAEVFRTFLCIRWADCIADKCEI